MVWVGAVDETGAGAEAVVGTGAGAGAKLVDIVDNYAVITTSLTG